MPHTHLTTSSGEDQWNPKISVTNSVLDQKPLIPTIPLIWSHILRPQAGTFYGEK